MAVACQARLSMGFSRQEYWSGFPCSPLGDLLNPGIEPASLTSLALAGRFFTTGTTWEAHVLHVLYVSIQIYLHVCVYVCVCIYVWPYSHLQKHKFKEQMLEIYVFFKMLQIISMMGLPRWLGE